MKSDKIAQLLREIYSSKKSTTPIRDMVKEVSPSLAYEIQHINTEHWLEQGRIISGRKVGLTSKSVQKQLGVDQPDFGILYADMEYASGDTIPFKNLIQPKVEAEIAFVLEEDLDADYITITDIINATDYLLPAIEIVDSRIENWNIRFFDTVADNASSALYVLGDKPVYLDDIDLQLCGMAMKKNGQPVSTGAGVACLGNPLIAAKWLANKMVSLDMPLLAGEVILTGALGPMCVVEEGDTFVSSISGFQELRIKFE